jgi:hypothetical protein
MQRAFNIALATIVSQNLHHSSITVNRSQMHKAATELSARADDICSTKCCQRGKQRASANDSGASNLTIDRWLPHTLFVDPVDTSADAHQLLEAWYVIKHDAVEHGAPATLIPQFETLMIKA